jgi:uncharacterized protein YcaQ
LPGSEPASRSRGARAATADPVRLTREQARRITVRAQLLDAPGGRRPDALVPVVDQLTALQIDPIAAIAPSADIVAWTRLGEAYDPSDLRFALDTERSLVEYGSFVHPMDDMGLWLAVVSDWDRFTWSAGWIEQNARFKADVLARLEADGPLVADEIDDTAEVPWESSGWTNNRNVTQMLEFLGRRGEIAVSGRRGKLREWDLAERVYPPDLVLPPYEEARAELDRRALAALGIVRRPRDASASARAGGHSGVEATVEGTDGIWWVDPDALAALDQPFEGRAALLSPYDRLVYDRDRALDLFDFEYVLEMYKPATKRRWGYYALPILVGDRLVGKLDAKADRKKGTLTVFAVHEDLPFDDETAEAVDAEIEALAAWLGTEIVRG